MRAYVTRPRVTRYEARDTEAPKITTACLHPPSNLSQSLPPSLSLSLSVSARKSKSIQVLVIGIRYPRRLRRSTIHLVSQFNMTYAYSMASPSGGDSAPAQRVLGPSWEGKRKPVKFWKLLASSQRAHARALKLLD